MKHWRYSLVLLLPLAVFLFTSPASAATYTVNSTDADSDGSCDVFVDGVSDCTLLEALIAANVNAGHDTVTFNIDGSFAKVDGQWQILVPPATGMHMSDSVTIDASSVWNTDLDIPGVRIENTTLDSSATVFLFQSGAADSQISGLEIVGGESALSIQGANMTIGTNCDGSSDAHERNVIHSSGSKAIFVTAGVSGYVIAGNYIGVDSAGTSVSGTANWGITTQGGPGLIGYKEGTSGTCSAAVQRNVIGASGGAWGYGVQTTESAQDVVISGNYIGVGADGSTSIGDLGYDGVRIDSSASGITVGTDGDGTDDDLEGNLIGGWSKGIFARDTATNVRASGNWIGFASDHSTAVANATGITIRIDGMIVGWCDTGVHATLCSDAGSQASQANVIGHSTSRGIRFDRGGDGAFIYGNYIGTDSTGVSDFGNTEHGIQMRQTDEDGPFYIGANTANQTNLIKFNGIGIFIDGQSKGDSFTALEDYRIVGNTISNNDTYGVHVHTTELYGTEGPNDGQITDNTIENNGDTGVLIEGSSPLVQDNTVSSNGAYGVYAFSDFKPTLGSYTNPYGTLSPDNADNDVVAQPNITGNTVQSNTSGGIYLVDAEPWNDDTLVADNTVSGNTGFNIRKDWYVGVELFLAGTPLAAGVTTVRLLPSGALDCVGTCEGSSVASAGGSNYLWGPSGVDYDDETTWFQVPEYLVDTDDQTVQYSPYRVQVTGEHINEGGVPVYTVDADTTDDEASGGLDAGKATGVNSDVYRYQVLEANVQYPQEDSVSVDLPQASIAHTPLGQSDTSVLWYFRNDDPTIESFDLIRYEDEDEIVIVSGRNLANKAYFLEETGLSPETEYCDRYIVAHNSAGSSDAILLPCVQTQLEGVFLPVIGVACVVTAAEAFLYQPVTGSSGGMFGQATAGASPLLALGLIMLVGGMRVRHKRRRGTVAHEKCREMYKAYFAAGVAVGVVVFFAVRLSAASPFDLAPEMELVPIEADTVLQQGDRVHVDVHVANFGDIAGQDIFLGLDKTAGLTVDEQSVKLNGDRPLLDVSEEQVTLRLDEITPDQELSIGFDATIDVEVGLIQYVGHLWGENVEDSTSNTLYFDVGGADEQEGQEELGDDEALIDRQDSLFIPRQGALVRAQTVPTIYFIGSDGQRHAFPRWGTFRSWFPEDTDVQVLSDVIITQIPTGPDMTLRSGTLLVKAVGEPFVYALEPDRTLRWIPSEEEAARLYGSEWAALVIDLSVSEMATYDFGPSIEVGGYPSGMLVSDGIGVCYIDQGMCRPVSENGYRSNGFLDQYTFPVPFGTLQQFGAGALIDHLEPKIVGSCPCNQE